MFFYKTVCAHKCEHRHFVRTKVYLYPLPIWGQNLVPTTLTNLHFRTRLDFGLAYMLRLRVRIAHVAVMVKVRLSIQWPQPWLCVFVCIQVLHVITVAPDSQLQRKKEISLPWDTPLVLPNTAICLLKIHQLLRAHIHTQTHTLTHCIQHQQMLT